MQKIVKKNFTSLACVWFLILFLLLFQLLTDNWRNKMHSMHQELQLLSEIKQNKIEEFFDELLDTIYSLPIYGANLKNCNVIHPQLLNALFKNPKISGLSLSEKDGTVLCSTYPANQMSNPPAQSKIVFGPFVSPNKSSYFILQQQFGNYFLSIYFLQSVLEEALHEDNPLLESIVLYNENTSQIVAGNTYQPFSIDDYNFRVKLESVDNLSLRIKASQSWIQQRIVLSEIILGAVYFIAAIALFLFMRSWIKKRFSLHGQLKNGVEDNNFYPTYQPIFDSTNNRFNGAEILLRWKTLDEEILLPEHFIDEAESSQLILPITLQIVEKAFQEFTHTFPALSSFYLTINVSGLHFKDSNFFKKFIALAQQYNISPSQIIFELTERDLINKNDEIFVTKMKELRAAGFSLALDDFGSGHANIGYLQSFPFNYLKIDKQFVQAIGSGAITESLVDRILDMAEDLNLTVVAEGVENSIQLEYLIKRKVQFLQGWHFAKAMSIEELFELIKGK